MSKGGDNVTKGKVVSKEEVGAQEQAGLDEDPEFEMLGRSERSKINMVIYGRSGAGKTYRAATAPSPYILACDPIGHDSIPFKLPGKVVYTLEEIADVIRWFEDGRHVAHGIKTLIVDGLNFIHDMFLKETGEYMVSAMGAKDPDLMPIAGQMKILRTYKRMLLRTINLTQLEQEDYRVHVVFTCLDEHLKDSEEAPFQIRPLFGSKSMNQTFPALFSAIGYIIPTGEDEEGSISSERRMLFTEYRGILARDRLGIFPLMGEAPNLSEYLK